MFAIDAHALTTALLIIECIIYIGVIIVSLRRREGQEIHAYLVTIYTGIAFFGQLTEVLWNLGIVRLAPEPFQYVEYYTLMALAVVLLLSIRTFLRLEGGEGWLIFGGAWIALIALIYTAIIPLPQTILSRERLTFDLLTIGWGIFNVASVMALRTTYLRMRQPLHRNRMSYWLPVLILLIANDALVFLSFTAFGSLLRMAGIMVMGYVVLTHHVPDSRDLFRRVLIYIITTLLVVMVYVAGVIATQVTFQQAQGYDPLLVGAIIALLLSILFNPTSSLVRRLVNRWFIKEYYNPSETLREYSLRISNILDVEKLATIAVGMIIDAMEISRGFLFLVDKTIGGNGITDYCLRIVRAEGDGNAAAGRLSELSPITRYLIDERKPLLQYDIDLLPVYQKTPMSERSWLSSLDSEVYVPIYSKGEWIGLFAFGAKLSGNRYTDEDLIALFTLANQTAVALENARLVENQEQLIDQLRKAYRELDEVNRNLEKIDRTKSDFISIASHELRTPLTVARGYAGMLLDVPAIEQEEFLKKMVLGINESTLRMHEIMESMFDIVQIDNRTLDIHMQDVAVPGLVRNMLYPLREDAEKRKIVIDTDLPALPKIKADPNLLIKLFTHIVRNAIKFTPDGGKITISGKPVTPTTEMTSGGIEIIVSDTGVGIDPEFRELIFTKFYQSSDLNRHSTGKSKFKGAGAGLGLALSKGIVEAHGGKLWVESSGYDEEKFPGSHFHIVLPITHK